MAENMINDTSNDLISRHVCNKCWYEMLVEKDSIKDCPRCGSKDSIKLYTQMNHPCVSLKRFDQSLLECEGSSTFEKYSNRSVQWCADDFFDKVNKALLNLNVALTDKERRAMQNVITNIFSNRSTEIKAIELLQVQHPDRMPMPIEDKRPRTQQQIQEQLQEQTDATTETMDR